MQVEWSVVVKADSPAELRDELQAVAGYVHMFPSTITHAPVDTQIEVTPKATLIRVE